MAEKSPKKPVILNNDLLPEVLGGFCYVMTLKTAR